jgi:ADP-ribose pyrophosphatase YjhB (NUDIX family)
LWMKRATGPFAGRWAIPGGFVEHGESVTAAASREIREETRVRLGEEDFSMYGVLSIPHINEVHFSMSAPLSNMVYGPTREALDVRLMSEREIADEVRAFSPGTDGFVIDLYRKLHLGDLKATAAVLMQI